MTALALSPPPPPPPPLLPRPQSTLPLVPVSVVLVLERLLALARVQDPGPRTEPVPRLKADVEERLPEEEELVLRRRPPGPAPAAKEGPTWGAGTGREREDKHGACGRCKRKKVELRFFSFLGDLLVRKEPD